MAATVKELKDIIVDLKMDLVKANIPSGNCPYAYYPVSYTHLDVYKRQTNERLKQLFYS